jgi:hypothetical protein
VSKAKHAGIYLASANWDRITAWVGASLAGVAADVIPPWLLPLLLPVLVHHWLQALGKGRQLLVRAAMEAKVEEYAQVFGQRMGVDEKAENEEGKA